MRRALSIAAVAWLACGSAGAHRLDEYLQGTLVAIGRRQVDAEMTLTPGVAVFPAVMAAMDTDGDGMLSPAEQQAYARRVMGDLTLLVDGRAVTPRLGTVRFPDVEDMKEGRGEIRIAFTAGMPSSGGRRILTIENRHLAAISVYQVNALAPRDPDLKIEGQRRNYMQSRYEVEFAEPGGGKTKSLGVEAGLLAGWLLIVWGVRKKL
ncbi:MAG TPA: hypothetical protein VHA14_14490 [Bryobacteraceae bacterium]|nr:hypothetical protein [Bryobacteraceae bacterium]